jgi:RHH-type proline utilization regulon transcriptional repressor/proline dehydrogenase/delta 1-pyrroline-5-carboxylate dehydrogenase
MTKNLETQAKELAKTWLINSEKYKSCSDKIYASRMDKFFQNSTDKAFIIEMIDKAFRPSKTKDIAHIIGAIPALSFLSPLENVMRILYNSTRSFAHFISIPLLKNFIYYTTSKYVLFGDVKVLEKRIQHNLRSKIRTNLNRIGELLLGENDAKKRMAQYVTDLENPHISTISIKISTIYSQISSIAFDQTVDALVERLTVVYRAAKENKYHCQISGQEIYKLVNLDMEEYRDLTITVAAFIKTLSQPEFKDLKAGIALQAYLPDSLFFLQKIVTWAQERVKNGGSAVRVRVVKGANMEMELFEAYERNWDLAPLGSKALTDANYKNMLVYALQPENISAVNIGVASHNLFDIAFIYLAAKENKVLDKVTFEMLSGMSEGVTKMMTTEVGLDVLLYLPFSGKEDFISAIGYLVRRLDENTSPENYLRYLNGLAKSKANLAMLEEKFDQSCSLRAQVNLKQTNRVQNRLTENFDNFVANFSEFKNEADTDFAIIDNQEFAKKIRAKWQNISGLSVPAVVNGKELFADNDNLPIKDHNDETKIVGKYYNSTKEDAIEALNAAKESTSWKKLSNDERLKIIAKVVNNIRSRRGDIIGVAALETGKSFIEADAEISEAIDFGNYYSHTFLKIADEAGLKYSAKGTVLVISPWNFPFAIPGGGIFAGLIAGNNVIFKPSNLSILTGYELAKCFWDAGVPKDALQFVPSINSASSVELSKSRLVDFIVFTGSTKTALSIINSNPKVKISAETGGKNVTIVTRFCDRDQAIKNALQSAFSNAGQKCSATSILALEKEVYEDEKFMETMADAARSLVVDYAWNFGAKVNTVIRKPLAELDWALKNLEGEEKWLVEPKPLNSNQTLWSPGIKVGTKQGQTSHLTEFFGPVLAVMKIDSLEDGIKLVNDTGYGLTSALESLNEAEQMLWVKSIKAGNLYVNRSSTGAIVCRQPFGGIAKSAFGTGIKAGGLNYICQFLNFENDQNNSKNELVSKVNDELSFLHTKLLANDKYKVAKVLENYLAIYDGYFSEAIDYIDIPGQSNLTRFLKTDNVSVRFSKDSALKELILVVLAAKLCVKKITISFENKDGLNEINSYLPELFNHLEVIVESNEDFAKKANDCQRIRLLPSKENHDAVYESAAKSGVVVIADEVIYNGRIELLNYLQEQSISNNYHRFGNINFNRKPKL